MHRSQSNNLKRRIEALERSPALQPLPEAPFWGRMTLQVAYFNLDVAHREAIRDMMEAETKGVLRIQDFHEPCAALRAAWQLETRRAAFTDFAEYEQAYSDVCLRRIPVTSTETVEYQIACQVTDHRFSHGAPIVPEGWKLPEGWSRQARDIWATKCKSLFCGRTPGGEDLLHSRKMRRYAVWARRPSSGTL